MPKKRFFIICFLIVLCAWIFRSCASQLQKSRTSSSPPARTTELADSTPSTWWSKGGGWKHRKKLTFFNQNQTEDLLDFPVLVHLTANNFDFAQAKSGGEDLRFLDADDKTELPHEIELWDFVKKEAYIWVGVPKIDALTNSDFMYMYHGNTAANDGQKPTEVWNDSYLAVWHFDDANDTSTIRDSTKNKHHGTRKSLNGPVIAQGLIGYGQQFDADNPDVISFPSIPAQKVPLTFSFLMKPTQKYLYVEGIYDSAPGVGVNALRNFFYRSDYKVAFFEWWNFEPNIYVIPKWNDWNSVIVGYYFDKTRKMSIYHDGVNHDSYVRSRTNTSSAVGWSTFSVGAVQGEAGSSYDGMLDEFRIAIATRSASWAGAEYATQKDLFIHYDQPTLEVKAETATSSKSYSTVHFSYSSLLPKRSADTPVDNLVQVYLATPSARIPLFFTRQQGGETVWEGSWRIPANADYPSTLEGSVEEISYGRAGFLPTHFHPLPTNFTNSGMSYAFSFQRDAVGIHQFVFDNVSTQSATPIRVTK